ncbi:immunity 49 family protein [Streptomyces sp. NPDC058637]|uniref:immunity 49 family protein n=1 Tax=Streptomyces sp. NPDC058637 TaxID=3346569 RepID=UPI00365996BF
MVEELTAAFRSSHPDYAALVEALEPHKAYWTADDDRENDIEGLWAIGPLAIACLAYDGGFPSGVESDYLPVQLLNRSWLGEFPT